MKRFSFSIIIFAALGLLFINTASAKEVFVPGQYVTGRGYVPNHWLAVPDDYPSGGSGLMGALMQQDNLDRQNFINALDSIGKTINRRRMEKFEREQMQRRSQRERMQREQEKRQYDAEIQARKKKKIEQEKKREQKKIAELHTLFLFWSDRSPSGLDEFALFYGVSHSEISSILDIERQAGR